MTRRRSRMEIYLDLLDAIGHGRRKITHIFYACNLDWTSAIKYLKHLQAKHLVKVIDNEWFLTEEGHIALKHGVDFKWAVFP